MGESRKRGLFVVFEGGDGAGKSTQVDLLTKRLEEAGRTVLATREPGAGEFGKRIRSILLDPQTGDISPRAEVLLFCADRAEHVDHMILPALERGEIVVCDRYIDSTFAYQGAGRALPLLELEPVAWWAAADLKPDLTVLLDLDPQEGLATIGNKDRMESAGEDFHARLRQGFLHLAAQEPKRYLVLNARDSREEISNAVWECLSLMLQD